MTLTKQKLEDALSAAGSAHHEYEQAILHGARDDHWSGGTRPTRWGVSVTLRCRRTCLHGYKRRRLMNAGRPPPAAYVLDQLREQ